MVRIALSLLALLSATYVVAGRPTLGVTEAVPTAAAGGGNLEAFCQKAEDAKACIELLKPAVTPTTQFDSLEWNRKVLSKALSKAITTKSFMVKHGRAADPRQQIAVTNCVDKIGYSVELIQQVSHEYVEMYKSHSSKGFLYEYHKKNVLTLMNTAMVGQQDCSMSLEGLQEPTLQQMKDLANKAYAANKIVSDLIFKS